MSVKFIEWSCRHLPRQQLASRPARAPPSPGVDDIRSAGRSVERNWASYGVERGSARTPVLSPAVRRLSPRAPAPRVPSTSRTLLLLLLMLLLVVVYDARRRLIVARTSASAAGSTPIVTGDLVAGRRRLGRPTAYVPPAG